MDIIQSYHQHRNQIKSELLLIKHVRNGREVWVEFIALAVQLSEQSISVKHIIFQTSLVTVPILHSYSAWMGVWLHANKVRSHLISFHTHYFSFLWRPWMLLLSKPLLHSGKSRIHGRPAHNLDDKTDTGWLATVFQYHLPFCILFCATW